MRVRFYRGAILFLAVFVGGFLLAGVILKKVLSFVHIDEVLVAASSPFQFVTIAMDVGFFLAIIVSIPYIIYSFYVFIVPALTKGERGKLLKSIPLSVGLFLLGFGYGFFVLYTALELFAAINIKLGIANIWNISQFLSEIFITSALLGFVFEFPLLLTLLIKIGVITTETLKNKRRVAIFTSFCVSALMPPADVLSLVAMAFPLMVLYELTILLNNKNKYVWIRNK